MKYMLDTNIITEILKNNEKVMDMAKKKIIEGDEVIINGISYYEIKRGFMASKATTQLKKFNKFCGDFGLALLDSQNIFDIASKIYADLKCQGNPIEDADILIASVALCNNAILVSADKHFVKIKELQKDLPIENWLKEC